MQSRSQTRSQMVLILCLVLGFSLATDERPQAAEGEEAVFDVSTCAGCHDDQILALAASPHASLDEAGSPVHLGDTVSCIACHGDPTAHIDEGGEGPIFAFGEGELPSVKANRCLDCHSDSHPAILCQPSRGGGPRLRELSSGPSGGG